MTSAFSPHFKIFYTYVKEKIFSRTSLNFTDRHDKVVERLTNAIRSGSISTNKTVADSQSPVCPDIVIESDDHATIIDVCCPFENSEEALEEASARKEVKYEHLRAHFETEGKTCSVYGLQLEHLAHGILAMNESFPPFE